MPRTAITPAQRGLLVYARDGRVVRGVLGELPHKANKRIFRDQDGAHVEQNTVTSLLKRGLIKVVATSGEDPPRVIDYMVTSDGRALAEHGTIVRKGRKKQAVTYAE